MILQGVICALTTVISIELTRRGDNDCMKLFPSHMDFGLLLDVYRHFIGTECADGWL